jgi:hypothetical protein
MKKQRWILNIVDESMVIEQKTFSDYCYVQNDGCLEVDALKPVFFLYKPHKMISFHSEMVFGSHLYRIIARPNQE